MAYRAILPCLALATLAPLLTPARAHAHEARSTSYETPARKGFYAELALRPGATVLRDGMVPALRHHFTFGAGLTDRFKLGMNLHIGGYLNSPIKKPVLGMDVIATGYVWRGMYVRVGAGMVNRLPVTVDGADSRAGYGGLVRVGYQGKVKGAGGIGLGADFDMKMISNTQLRRTFFLGLHFHFH